MIVHIVIPTHNEEAFIGKCLDSIIKQSCLPSLVMAVNDHSDDSTEDILKTYSEKYPYIRYKNHTSSHYHLPGSKVIEAFNTGLKSLNGDFDIIIKLDADIVLPKNYVQEIIRIFTEKPHVGIAGGYAYELDNLANWKLNHPMNTNHVRGAFKAYSKQCFDSIGGLKSSIGWDTIDELLAIYRGFEIVTEPKLKIKHLRPLSKKYHKSAKQLQGKAMYIIGYDILLALLTSLKMAYKQRKYALLKDSMQGYLRAFYQKEPKIVSPDEQRFVRQYRYKQILRKLSG